MWIIGKIIVKYRSCSDPVNKFWVYYKKIQNKGSKKGLQEAEKNINSFVHFRD